MIVISFSHLGHDGVGFAVINQYPHDGQTYASNFMILLSLGVSTVWTDRSVSPFADDPVFTGFADGIFAARCGKIVFIGIAKPLVDLFNALVIHINLGHPGI
jgi:hypothetical protein